MGSVCSYSPRHRNCNQQDSATFWRHFVVHQALKKTPSFENRGVTGVCPGHDNRVAGVLVVSVVNGVLREVCSAKVRRLGEKFGRAWRLHVHHQESSLRE